MVGIDISTIFNYKYKCMNMNYKVGDRIFFEYAYPGANGKIGEAIIAKIEPRSYKHHSSGKIINFNMLHTGKYTCIEDYNCLPEDDLRVIEYKQNNADPREFIEKFENFLKENNFNISQSFIQEYLHNL